MNGRNARSSLRHCEGIAILTILFLLSLPSFLAAQSEFDGTWGRELGRSVTVFRYEVEGAPAREVAGQHLDWQAVDQRASFSTPILQDRDREWTFQTRLRAKDVTTDAILPDTKEHFPGTLWDIEFGSRYLQRLSNGWIGGLSGSVGSASDRPFGGMDETTVSITASARIPHRDRNAWIVFLNYNNNRDFLNGFPIPGLGYWYEPDSSFRAIIGIPFVFLESKPLDDLTLDFALFPLRHIHAGASYRIAPAFKVHGAFDWRDEQYLRAARGDEDKRLFYYEKRLTIGCQWQASRDITLDLSGGYLFDRMFFEGTNAVDRDFNRLDIADAPFLSAMGQLRF